MEAITVWPCWAWAVKRLGKNIENRKHRTSMEIGTDLAIHAGKLFGGPNGKNLHIDDVFQPVANMARRAGWRLGIDVANNTVEGYSTQESKHFSDKVHQMPTMAVVAVVRFGGLLDPSTDRMLKRPKFPWWAYDQYGYILENIRVLEHPISIPGKQGIWYLKDPELSQVLEQIRGR